MNSLKPRMLKAKARQILQGKYGFFSLMTVLLMSCNSILGSILALVIPTNLNIFGFLIYLASLLIVNTISNILLSGIYRLYIHVLHDEPFGFQDLKDAFLEHPEPIAVYSLLALVMELIFVYTAAFSISGSYLGLGIFVIAALVMLWFNLTFGIILYLHAVDPQASTSKLLHQSLDIMKGHRLKLLWLKLTFVGVTILAVLSLGIGTLFVQPYRTMTHIIFYTQIANPQEN